MLIDDMQFDFTPLGREAWLSVLWLEQMLEV